MRFTPKACYGVEPEYKRFVDFVTRLCCQCLIVRHSESTGAKRDHCHLVIDYDKSFSRFRQKFRDVFSDYDGNKDYSMKDCSEDGDKPLWYICKYDNPDVLLKVKYTESDIETFHKSSLEYVAELKKLTGQVSDEKKSIPPSKKITENFVVKTVKGIKEAYPGRSWNVICRIERDMIYNYVCDMLGQYGKTLDEIIIYRLMGGVMMQLDASGAKHLYRRKVLDRFESE